jgi:flagellar hook assembly protein FlgD
MEVRRVFFPHATWENVLANIQDANLVVYMGHGYGFPSAYQDVLTESRQDGMGLNSFDGSGVNEYTYYGATRLRESVRLAPNAIVYLNHLCYSTGNGEPGMPIPELDIARQRVDNMASGWLSIGARAVFAYTWWQKLNLPQALMTTDQTIDQMFMTRTDGPYDGTPGAFIGWNESRFDSERTPGATIHLDPHPKLGYYRAVTGDMDMTAAEFRSTSTGTLGPDPTGPPEITSLTASGGTGSSGVVADPPVSFHPNGDGLDEQLVLTHAVTRPATLDATVTNAAGAVVRTYSLWSTKGTTTSIWNGRSDAGAIVPDGRYTLTYVPHDASGLVGDPVSVDALVLTAIKVGTPSVPTFFARDADALSKTVKLKVTVTQPAVVSWQILNGAGDIVRTVRPSSASIAQQIAYAWDGRTNSGSWAPDGWYRSVITATTDAGSYSQERRFYAGAFKATLSTNTPARGGPLTLNITSTERLSGAPVIHVTQPGVATWDATATSVGRDKYKVTINLQAGGAAGTLTLVVAGTDKNGGQQDSTFVLPLR